MDPLMRLAELEPQFTNAGGEGIYNADGTPAPRRVGIGLLFNCPCGCDTLCYVAFENPLDGQPPIDPSHPIWNRAGDTYDTLTLKPSIFRSPALGGCGWHGFIADGNVTGC